MRVLTVLASPPASQGGAADRCAIGLLAGQRAHGIDVRAVAPDHGRGWPDDALRLGVQRVPVQPVFGLRATLAHLRRPLGDLARTELRGAVAAAAADVDVVHLDRSDTSWLDEDLRTPTVMSLHYRARLDQPFSWPPWGGANRELLLFRALERSAVRRHRWLVASSEPVAAAIRDDRPGADVTVVPLSLDPDAYGPAPLDGPPVAGIIGTAGWPPTREALRRLVGSVWPLVRRAVPDARLLIAGRGTQGRGLEDPALGIEVVGEVASSQAFLGGLAALLYPVGRGSGMKVKVLEGLAMGLPVVTTACGAEGVARCDGVHVGEADDDLARATADVLLDVGARRSKGGAARALFLSRYAPAAATAPLVALFERVGA